MSGPRKGISKRRWKARARAGRWLPTIIVFMIDSNPDPLEERWAHHPTEPDFWRLKESWPSSKALSRALAEHSKIRPVIHLTLAEVAEVDL